MYEGLFEQLAKQEVEFAKVSEEALGAQDLPKFGELQIHIFVFWKSASTDLQWIYVRDVVKALK